MTTKFKKKHIAGFDCRLSTFRNTLAYNDVVLSNSMVLGLAGCLIFCYNDGQYYNRVSGSVIAGINDQSLEGLAFNLNIYLMRGRMFDIEDAKKSIPKYLALNLPVNIAINRPELKKIINQESLPANLGHHYITITDYDSSSDLFTIFETDTSQQITINSKQLEQIWFYDINSRRQGIDPFQPCDGQWYTFFSTTLSSDQLKNAAINGIKKVITNFFDSPVPQTYGIESLLNLKEKITGLKSLNDLAQIKDSIYLISFMESGMSGGGFGRKSYSFFLTEISNILQNKDLKMIALKFREVADLWKTFINNLRITVELQDSNLGSEHIISLKNQINEVCILEIECMTDLKNWSHESKNYISA
jgi:frataxin-like iron-binding protein CyaY/(2Fe-2S) ferredoxin